MLGRSLRHSGVAPDSDYRRSEHTDATAVDFKSVHELRLQLGERWLIFVV